jgi:hypothetical protein
METIFAAALTGAISLAVCLITNHAQAEKTRALIDYRVSELERKQDKHNNLMERTFKIEGCVQELQHEIVDLKKYHQP